MGEDLPVSEEIAELFDESTAAIKCRDLCIASVFKARRAIYYAKRDIQLRRKAWALVAELWPQTRQGVWTYFADERLVRPQK